MKLNTHYVFSTGLLTLVSTLLTHHFYTSILLWSGAIAVLGNTIIDRLGHEIMYVHDREIIRRTPLTHTIPRSAFWGFLPALGLALLYYYAYGYLDKELVLLTLISPLNGLSHMLLDVFTEKGIYVKRDGRWTRFALAHFSYNNPVANGLAIVLGVVMIFVAMNLFAFHYYYFKLHL